ncbi:hypothetical protein V5O48_016354 [Marasmius crinis-equi]|uniref:Uncharacterized protein n=1 Tax=Marasmius crinis-equi TaxID=585013 RepID=A0ABR3ERX2_9AGAR
MLKQCRYFLRSMVKKKRDACDSNTAPLLSAESSPGTPTPSAEEPQPIQIIRLPDSFDYDHLVERAAVEAEDEGDILEDLDPGIHSLSLDDGNDNLAALAPSEHATVNSPSDSIPSSSTTSYHHRKRIEIRKGKQKAEKDSDDIDYTPSARTVTEAIRKAKIRRLELDAASFNAAKGAHTAKPGQRDTKDTLTEKAREWTLQELVDLGYLHIPWDGVNPLLVVDCKGRIIAFLAGRPNRQDFVDDMMGLFDAMMLESKRMGWDGVLNALHKRGWFPAFNHGITMGMGTSTPVALRNDPEVEGVLSRLLSLPALKRLNGYHNGIVKTWEPRLHHAYRSTVETMHQRLPKLPRNFRNSIFTASAFNFGGKVRTIEHRDHMNWPFGLCVITAMGRFDATRSGHLVLKEFKLVFDFPHASTAAIPSACCTHFNTAIAPGDQRVSFTQYTAGAIFRWVENGCRTEASIKLADEQEWRAIQQRKKTAVAERLKLYSTVDEIIALVD